MVIETSLPVVFTGDTEPSRSPLAGMAWPDFDTRAPTAT
jgi:hypothetical protein